MRPADGIVAAAAVDDAELLGIELPANDVTAVWIVPSMPTRRAGLHLLERGFTGRTGPILRRGSIRKRGTAPLHFELSEPRVDAGVVVGYKHRSPARPVATAALVLDRDGHAHTAIGELTIKTDRVAGDAPLSCPFLCETAQP